MIINCKTINLKKGSSGDTVKTLQKYLTYTGYYDGKIDGECGDYTVQAIKKLQTMQGNTSDGVFGTKTCQKSYINGRDISSSTESVTLATFKDIKTRFEQYTKQHGVEPNISYINKEYPFEYITNARYKDMLQRYEAYVKQYKQEPKICYINKVSNPNSTSSDGNNNNTTTPTPNTNTTNQPNTTSTGNTTLYVSSPHWTSTGCNKLGQCTGYYCACHSLRQCLAKFGIDDYTEKTLAGVMGTTTNGTGHDGINTAIKWVANKKGVKLNYEWYYFSDLGSTTDERFKKLGQLISQTGKDAIIHSLYRNKYGHYEVIWKINTKSRTVTVLNSLGSKCSSPAYCGYIEERGFDTFASYIKNNYAGQKSICLITKG